MGGYFLSEDPESISVVIKRNANGRRVATRGEAHLPQPYADAGQGRLPFVPFRKGIA